MKGTFSFLFFSYSSFSFLTSLVSKHHSRISSICQRTLLTSINSALELFVICLECFFHIWSHLLYPFYLSNACFPNYIDHVDSTTILVFMPPIVNKMKKILFWNSAILFHTAPQPKLLLFPAIFPIWPSKINNPLMMQLRC